ncbi:MAG: hypothetical protein JNM86_06690 [Phycisphaerae bacterium]|nr:hypothetical protein [Phycisphaerae bacterium]MBN8598370.1 hypothetical protein [Planctomycetota bacterium]
MNFDAPLHLKPCCLNMRHKMMYCDPRQATPGLIDGDSETRVLLCVLTQEVLGPDDKPVGMHQCSPDRPCYRGAKKPESWAEPPKPNVS